MQSVADYAKRHVVFFLAVLSAILLEPSSAPAQGASVVQVRYFPPRTAAAESAALMLRTARPLEAAAKVLASTIRIPRRINIDVRSCSTENATYDPSNRSITVCYELPILLKSILCGELAEERHVPCGYEFADSAVLGMVRFIAYHELGHAVIDILSIPAVGREESVADQFAAYMIINYDHVSRVPIIDARLFFQLLANLDQDTKAAKEDPHLLNAQRDADLACWLIATGVPREIVDLSNTRALSCAREVRVQQLGWQQLLRRYLKSSPRARSRRE